MRFVLSSASPMAMRKVRCREADERWQGQRWRALGIHLGGELLGHPVIPRMALYLRRKGPMHYTIMGVEGVGECVVVVVRGTGGMRSPIPIPETADWKN